MLMILSEVDFLGPLAIGQENLKSYLPRKKSSCPTLPNEAFFKPCYLAQIFYLVIILLILITLALENVWIMLGEILCWSLLELKGLKQFTAVAG